MNFRWYFIFGAFILLGVTLLIREKFFTKNKDRMVVKNPAIPVVAVLETEPVPSSGDAADDPAFWYNQEVPSLSTIIGTDKDRGLAVYDLNGKEIQFLPDGKMNNVDVRYNFPLAGESVALVTASNQTDGTIAIYKVNADTRKLENVEARDIYTVAPYGCCMYHSAVTGKFYYFVNSRDGDVEQWELFDNGFGKVEAKRVRTFKIDSDTEGCVADDELGYLYLGEEERGIWKYGAEPEAGETRILIDSTYAGGHLSAEVEGLTLYYSKNGSGYLIASSQAKNEFVVYKREGDNDYLLTFQIVSGDGVDGVTHTDGVEVTSVNLGPSFPEGLFIAQDHDNEDYNQNYKLVRWDSIAKKMATKTNLSKDRLF